MEGRHTGDLVSRLTNDTALLQTFFIQHFANLFYLPVVFAGALVMLLLTSWKLILSSLILLPVGIAVTALLSRPIRPLSERLQEQVGRVNAIAQDAIGGISILRAFHMGRAFFQSYKLALDESVKQSLRLEKRKAAMAPISLLLLSTPIILVIVVGGYLIGQGELTAGNIILFLYLLSFILQPISMMPLLFVQIGEALGAAQRLLEVLELPVEKLQTEAAELAGSAGGTDETVIARFDRVSFAYGGGSNVLDEVSFQLKSGETLAIVGPSGGGKSTLLKLLCGFYEASSVEGRIELFGRPLLDWPLDELRARIAVVMQDTYLFPVPVAENIGYGRAGASMEAIVEAAKAAQAHDFIMKLPQGYGTETGERGGRLSGGQKQRIAIARALLKDAPLLLLDEPTSALDSQSEANLQEALERIMAGRTVLVIAHRLSTVRRADRILVLDQGRIAESGTHEELLHQNGLYRKWVLMQSESESFATEADRQLADGIPPERSNTDALEAGV
jgi:ABC-type multidrug transport system fused ATPase/permease subunit